MISLWMKIKKEVRKVVLKFGKDQCDFLIERFGLSEVYKQTYEDKNIMYKVKHDYLRKLDDKRSVIRNLSFYYYDEIKVSLPNLYYFWILLLTKKFSHSNFEGIFDITYSIMERIKQLFFTYSIIEDIIKGAKHYGNPDTFFVFFYHFSYFVSLVKTIGDNLAWMLKFYLDLNINHLSIDLSSDKFKAYLTPKTHYFDLVYSKNYYEEYKKLSDLRDIIQHRHIIRDIRAITKDKQNKILIPKDPEGFISKSLKLNKNRNNNQRILLTEDTSSAILDGLNEYYFLSESESLNDYEDPLVFCQRHTKGISLVIDGIFSRIVNETTRIFVGEVTYFYPKNNVAVINVSNELRIGDQILIEGKNTSLQQQNMSMEIEHNNVEKCEKGLAGIKVNGRVKPGDKIYKITKIDCSTFLRDILF